MLPRWLQCALLLMLAASPLAGQKKARQPQQLYYNRPDQTVDLASPQLISAKQPCENWALAAGLETLLKAQGVALSQSFWVMRLNGGELCIPQVPAFSALREAVDDEFVLDDGRHVRLTLNVNAGAPTSLDGMISGLQQSQTAILILRGHPYYVTGMTYDEHIGQDGSRIFLLKEIRLANTFPGQPGTTFDRGRDDPQDIQGILTVSVTAL